MAYTLLGVDLWDVADFAKKHFSGTYGATKFRCEEAISAEYPLRPTWHAKAQHGYLLCIEAMPTPFSQSLYEFVTICAQSSVPIKLWVAVPDGTTVGFADHLKKARDAGVGVVQFRADGSAHEFHRATPLSLFGLKKTDFSKVKVPKNRRDYLKNAESTFLEGSPGAGCQEICQELERVTRDFAEYTHSNGHWSTPSNMNFATDPWARVLRELEKNLNEQSIRARLPHFHMQRIVEARAYTDWRNTVSHRPKTLAALKKRDARLRTMFEVTRDLLTEWWDVARPIGLLK